MDEFYRVPLSSAEALATVAALRALDALVDSGAVDDPALALAPGILASAAERIAAELPEFLADQATALSGTIAHALMTAERIAGVDDEEGEARDTPPFPIRRTRRLLEDAYENATPVEIEYFVASRKQWTHRRVDISDVYEKNGIVYLTGECGLRGDFRQFRIDHIRSVRVLDDEDAAPERDPFDGDDQP